MFFLPFWILLDAPSARLQTMESMESMDIDRNKFWESLGWTETANGECGRKLVAASEHYPLARMVGDPEVHWEEIWV